VHSHEPLVMPRGFDAGVEPLHAAADGGFAEAQYHAWASSLARN
jgi:hypothetical protein